MSGQPLPRWSQIRFGMEDKDGKPLSANAVLPYPIGDAKDGRMRPSPAPFASGDQLEVNGLCTLPPTNLAQRIPSNLLEPDDGCRALDVRVRSSPDSGTEECPSILGLNLQCIWNALTRSPNDIELKVAGQYCLPLDDPVLASLGGIAPVPILPNTTQSMATSFSSKFDYRIVPALKHHLESRNHSAANLPVFANVTVRPTHKRLRLGVCVPLPPIGSPCSLLAIDNSTGTIANDWLFPGGSSRSSYDIALARPPSSLSPMAGPAINTLDHAATRDSQPPYPFLRRLIPENEGSPQTPYNALVIPMVGCAAVASDLSPSSTLGVVRPLVINGTCTSGRECLSGVCNLATSMCDNAIKPETNSPFSSKFTFQMSPLRPFLYPSNSTVRQIINQYSRYSFSDLPEMWTYYRPLTVAGGALLAVLVMTCIWTGCGQRLVRKWTSGRWRTTTERDMELKPVSGRMVPDIGDERAVQEAVEVQAEELPVYLDQ